jgi:CRISPR-associated protein Csb1
MTSKVTTNVHHAAPPLSAAVGGAGPDEARWACALRLRCELQPAGGPGSKVMPPTYSSSSGPTYITEKRRIEDNEHDCVLLDGIASQANRIEPALAARVGAGEIPLPTIEVDQDSYGTHSGLDFSHRCFDAWIEDAQLGDKRFGETNIFKRLAASPSRHDLTAMMQTFPVGILLGCWASRKKNPQGTTRLARILTSEIIAVNAVAGERPASRIDRHHVSSAVKLVRTADTTHNRFEITPDENGKTPEEGAESPSELGYGNIPPSFASHGGITMGHALQIATVSLPALRECGFPGEDGGRKDERDVAGRMMLSSLALRMLALQVEHGYDLRSGCRACRKARQGCHIMAPDRTGNRRSPCACHRQWRPTRARLVRPEDRAHCQRDPTGPFAAELDRIRRRERRVACSRSAVSS